MTIVEGQIETLKNLKNSLNERGITKFESIGEINRFQRRYESEKRHLPLQVGSTFEGELEDIRTSQSTLELELDRQKADVRSNIEEKIQELEEAIDRIKVHEAGNFLHKLFIDLKSSYYLRRKTHLEKNTGRRVQKRTKKTERELLKMQKKLEHLESNKESIIEERLQIELDELNYTKKVLDDLYPLISGAVGEHAVVKTLNKLPDDYHLINDFSVRFNPPIFNKKENDRIFSVQIDHLLVCTAGVFLLETKNWSKTSIKDLDLRSPVEQILRASYALFVLLNSTKNTKGPRLKKHHWGKAMIPIRNVIVMINEKPKTEFRHVKVLSLNELIGYIGYFDSVFNIEEVRSIFEYLKKSMREGK